MTGLTLLLYVNLFSKAESKEFGLGVFVSANGWVSFNKEDDEKDDLVNYSPEESVKKQLEKEQQQNESEKLQQQFDDIYKSEYEEARYKNHRRK